MGIYLAVSRLGPPSFLTKTRKRKTKLEKSRKAHKSPKPKNRSFNLSAKNRKTEPKIGQIFKTENPCSRAVGYLEMTRFIYPGFLFFPRGNLSSKRERNKYNPNIIHLEYQKS